MSELPNMRRADKQMDDASIEDLLANGFSGRLATIGADGYPYCVPLLHVWMDGEIFVHNTAPKGHLRRNVDHEDRVCFETDDGGEVLDYAASKAIPRWPSEASSCSGASASFATAS